MMQSQAKAKARIRHQNTKAFDKTRGAFCGNFEFECVFQDHSPDYLFQQHVKVFARI
jgi:hypothetical protein